ncbi:hypothetical protein MPLB_210032 [Mesorhizobium sp. ORS 3324]|nr:hypothetical protein MPLB_210032 [Mesorhizobium sp. ORS 3324]
MPPGKLSCQRDACIAHVLLSVPSTTMSSAERTQYARPHGFRLGPFHIAETAQAALPVRRSLTTRFREPWRSEPA